MAVVGGPDTVVTDGLVLCIDPANLRSYQSGSTDTFSLVPCTTTGSLKNNVSFLDSNSGVFNFDGSDDIITFGSNSALQIVGDLTIDIWFYPENLTPAGGILHYGLSGESIGTNALYYLDKLADSNDMRYVHEYDSGTNQLITFNTNFTLNQWQHIIVTRDASAKTVKCFIDAVETSNSLTYTTAPAGGDDGKFVLGQDFNGSTIDAQFSSIKIYNKTFTVSEVTQNYNALKDRFQ